jgi:hypothetical protein
MQGVYQAFAHAEPISGTPYIGSGGTLRFAVRHLGDVHAQLASVIESATPGEGLKGEYDLMSAGRKHAIRMQAITLNSGKQRFFAAPDLLRRDGQLAKGSAQCAL